MFYAFDYIAENGGIDTESSYGYEASDEQCRFDRHNVGATLSDNVRLLSGDENSLTNAIGSLGPVSVAIQVTPNFKDYYEGVFDDDSCDGDINHAVLTVGYGNENGQDYYIVKNSWSDDLGDEGYIKMSRNANNQYRIASYAMYPIV